MTGNGTGTRASARAGMIDGRFVRNTWYVAGWSESLAEGKLLGIKILGEPICLFRKSNGEVAAIDDRCPHRFAPLSMGRVVAGDKIQCLYHGLEFDGAGACVKNPHPPGNIPSRARLRSYPVVERHKAMWIWMGDKTPDPAKIPDFSVLDNAPEIYGTKRDKIMVKSNYELVVDNLLDLSHGCYLHEGLLGNADTVESEITVEQDGDDVIAGRHASACDPPGMWRMLWPTHPPKVDKFSKIRWMAPSTLRLFVGVCEPGKPWESGTGYHAIHLLTPETDRSTHYFFTAVRFGVKTTDEALNQEIQGKIAKMRRFAFEEQDAPVIEAQQTILDEAPEALDPISLSIDVGPVRYKRVLQRMIEAER
jgi:phenylpropionate dioxygenase-like ring-hydroxylating dioxygenase large terminal subunit